MTLPETIAVYDGPKNSDRISILDNLRRNVPVYVIEPFHAFHHKKGILFFPPHLPPYIQKLIHEHRISVIGARQLRSYDIYMLAADKAVGVVESVYFEYRQRHSEFMRFMTETLKSPIAENAFKNHLCTQLAEFYSTNILLQRIDKAVEGKVVYITPDTNTRTYKLMASLLESCRLDFFNPRHIRFSKKSYAESIIEGIKTSAVSTFKVLLQTVASKFKGRKFVENQQVKREYTFGVSILGPRQLRGGNRGPDFLIDHDKIRPDQVVYLPQIPLEPRQKEALAKLPGHIFMLPETGRFFSNYDEWKRLLWFSLKLSCSPWTSEINIAANVLLNYFRWQFVTRSIQLKHYITHADFGPRQIGRNLALHQSGTQTWYFTDSMNHMVNFKGMHACQMRHPFWTYLSYQHLVTWDDLMAAYYRDHPGSFKETHVVGCLWSGHIDTRKADSGIDETIVSKDFDTHYKIACFDSTYTNNGFTSYDEGIAFIEHLKALLDDFTDIVLLFKEKKDRALHPILDPIRGPELITMYDKLCAHPRVRPFTNQMDASDLISAADMVISFPFTSTTFEALSANKPAIWHDPHEKYRNTVYGCQGGAMTHGYPDLQERIEQAISGHSENISRLPEMDPDSIDPYRDKDAIARFRTLLSTQ